MHIRKPGRWLEIIALGALSAAAAGCAPDTAGASSGCSPGETVPCECEDGSKGTRDCSDDSAECAGCGDTTATGSGGSGATGGNGTGNSGGQTGTGGAGAGPFSLNDSLKNSSSAGNPVGGTFGPDGWTINQKTDRIWYALPRLVEGSIEFTVTGITTANLDLADHEIFSLYDAGHGIAEPINYNPEFRDNHFKQLIRIYGQMVPERLGLQKYIMLMCPDGAPGYGQCVCGKSFYDGDGWWGGDGNWTGAPSKIKVTWGNGKATYARDGVDVWTNDYAQSGLTFGPSELHFTIGCPRADAIGDAGMPIGATFSDVIVQGIQGDIATCN